MVTESDLEIIYQILRALSSQRYDPKTKGEHNYSGATSLAQIFSTPGNRSVGWQLAFWHFDRCCLSCSPFA